MLLCVEPDGVHPFDPNPGETVENAILRVLGVEKSEKDTAVEVFNPKFVTRAMNIGNVLMYARKYGNAEPNPLAKVMTADPNCPVRGTFVLAAVRCGSMVQIEERPGFRISGTLNYHAEELQREKA